MGWLFNNNWKSPSDIKKEILADFANNENVHILKVASTNYGRHLWLAASLPDGQSLVLFFLMEKQDSGWGYKDMDETMGPYYHDCPLSFLKITEKNRPMNPSALNWREAVHAYHNAKNREFTPGQGVRVYDRIYTIIRKEKRSWIVKDHNNKFYKVNPANIE